jgi:hypothetical protein
MRQRFVIAAVTPGTKPPVRAGTVVGSRRSVTKPGRPGTQKVTSRCRSTTGDRLSRSGTEQQQPLDGRHLDDADAARRGREPTKRSTTSSRAIAVGRLIGTPSACALAQRATPTTR